MWIGPIILYAHDETDEEWEYSTDEILKAVNTRCRVISYSESCTSMRKYIALIIAVLALAVGGCGGVGHAVGGIAGHHVANKLAPGHKRAINGAFCLYHGRRLLIDAKHHHLIGAGINAYQAFKSCKGFIHPHS